MNTYKPTCGTSIESAAKEMVKIANETLEKVTADFNGIKIVVNPGYVPQGVVDFYHKECNRRAEEYSNSPEGKRAAAEAEELKQKAQQQMDEAMLELDSLDFSNFNVVINWLDKVRGPSDYVGTIEQRDKIAKVLRSNGYEPGVNCEEAFDGENEENFARWLIGQALECLISYRGIHQIFQKFAEDWRKKFGYA